ncbi:helix-turn-helix domain-containing protein [Naasia sp. SYSU D00948]|uniref:helix-turn-helix domain-containing protein n=1 Tax=Naasia sp. SYSU D00948 TaxID=2817379 RepID=UPI0027DBC3A7|nr:helix-turn-helix domain-containing protein [Naasia sp. SYSU D00948]
MAERAKANRGPSAGPENRRALIGAAREVFAEFGYSAPLSAVARRAGVGQGSLYRHFPDRISLAVAVFDENLDAIEALVAGADSTLDDLLDLAGEQAMVGTAFVDLVGEHQHDPRVEALGARVGILVARLLEREQRAGRVSQDITTDDVELALFMLAGTLSRSDPDQRPDVARRAKALFHAAFAPADERTP